MKRVLILEDNDIHRQLLVDGFRDQGDEVLACADVAAAHSVLATQTPDVMVIDLKHGEHQFRGVEFAEEMRRNEKTKNVPLLLVTAYDESAARARDRLEDAKILAKPFDYEALHSKVREVMKGD